MRIPEAFETRVAEPAAGPKTPTQTHDFGAAFRAKIRTIIREERQVYEDLSLLNWADYRLISNRFRPASVRNQRV